MKEFRSIILVGIGIIIIWFVFGDSGGLLGALDTPEARPRGTVEEQEVEKISVYTGIYGSSPFTSLIELQQGRAHRDERDDEYVTIEAVENLTGTVTISGWTLLNTRNDRRYTIPQSPTITFPNDNTPGRPVPLSADHRAYVFTGFSPIGDSFRTNICTGYLGKEHPITPSPPRECPRPEEPRVLEQFRLHNNEECVAFLETISRCTDPRGVPNFDEDDDDAISRRCEDYIREEVTYEGCVRNNLTHVENFYADEWYLYLDTFFTVEDLWKESDTVLLLDNNNLLVDVLSL